MIRSNTIVAGTVLLIVAFCFVGCLGGGSVTGFSDEPPPPVSGSGPGGSLLQADVGSANMPSGTISARFENERVAAGTKNNLLVTFSSGYPAIASVQAGIAIGTAGQTLGTVRTTPLRPGTYRVDVTLPQLMQSGHRVSLRVVHVDGSVVESGIEDYLIRF